MGKDWKKNPHPCEVCPQKAQKGDGVCEDCDVFFLLVPIDQIDAINGVGLQPVV
ncbi:hypothetical protein KJ853_03060 [Patescibacteria group bacterium]|nr:hypothetical protein [Patescibacteria group bacterium]